MVFQHGKGAEECRNEGLLHPASRWGPATSALHGPDTQLRATAIPAQATGSGKSLASLQLPTHQAPEPLVTMPICSPTAF